MMDHTKQFREAMQAAGLEPPAQIEAGKRQRFSGAGKRKGRDAWCKLFPDGGGGVFGDWSTGLSESWQARRDHPYTATEREAFRKRCEAERAARQAELEQRHADAAIKAAAIWEKAQLAGADHPYLVRKSVGAYGVRAYKGALVVPMCDADGALHSLQFIPPASGKTKLFLRDGCTKGHFFAIGEPDGALCIAEGYATAASIHKATGYATAVAFYAGNLEPVARALWAKYPKTKIVVCGDTDQSGVGQAKAHEAAIAVSGLVALPDFTTDELAREKPPSDFNDLAALRGLEVVKALIRGAACASGGGEAAIPVNYTTEDFEATVARLAALKPHEYDRERKAESKRLGVQIKTLDDAVTGQRARQEGGGAVSLFPDVEPWPDPVNGAALLDEISSTVLCFIVCDKTVADTVALWVAFTWLIDHFHIAPMILITAPEMRCGKTQLLSLIGKLVRHPLAASNISPAATYRVIEAHSPTLLIDEADAFFRDNEELRGIVNSGHGRDSAYVLRTVGENFEPKRFSTWGAKVLCGIGRLQSTLMDRSLVLELRRKGAGETAEKLRYADPAAFGEIASRLSRYADDHGVQIGQARPSLPSALHDRAQDNWEPLLAIADHAGGGWPERARSAALKMAGAELEVTGQEGSLLVDIAAAFVNTDRLATAELLEALCADPAKPWATYARGKPITARHLAKRLQGYKIFPRNVRTGGAVQKGYLRADFADTFSRYLSHAPDNPVLSATPLHPAESLGLFNNLSATRSPDVADRKSTNQLKLNDCSGVADKPPQPGQEVGSESETAPADPTSEYEL